MSNLGGKQDLQYILEMHPQFKQGDLAGGVARCIVVDVRDPYMRGRVRALSYGTDGDYPNLDIYTLHWAESNFGPGQHTPYELGDRVLVSYDASDKESPIVVGSWRACPMGDGELPWNKREGSEVRSEGWHNHDLYPEGIVVGSSRNGNVINILDAFMSEKDLASTIQLQDVSGRFLRLWSIKSDVEVWSPKIEFEEGKGQLMGGGIGENKSLRYGYESQEDLEDCLGSIEMGYQGVLRTIVGSKEDFTQDLLVQRENGKQGDLTREERSVSGTVFTTSLAGSAFSMLEGSAFLTSGFGDLSMPPRKW